VQCQLPNGSQTTEPPFHEEQGQMVSYTPEVKQAHAFREISQDFTTPEEIFREAIANALDAYARTIWLRTSVENRRGRGTVLIDLSDDGIGMNSDTIKAFFKFI
jgi:hypothetical protein